MDINKLAVTLDTAAHTATPTPQLSDSESLSLEDAYKVQKLSVERRMKQRGEKLTGVKMGFTSKAKMEQMGVHDLIWGRLTDGMFYEAGSQLKKADFIHPRAEPEIAFRLAKTIDKELTLTEIKDYVDGVAVALEIIDSRYKDFKFSLEEVVADNCSSAGYSLGEWKSVDVSVENILMSMVSDDVIVSNGNSSAILGNPWEALVAATRLAATNNQILEAGTIVLAGAATAAKHIKKDETISAHADGLGSVYLDIV